jgi:transcriptional adapter 2-alpha
MPARGEFEYEWEDGLEKKIMDIEFHEHDTPEEFEAKMQALERYNQMLDKRHAMRKLVVEKRLHDKAYQAELKKARTPREEKLHKEYKRFLQSLTTEEYGEFIKGLARQQELEDKIKELQEYRKAGLTNLQEVGEYKQLHKKKQVSHCLKQSAREPETKAKSSSSSTSSTSWSSSPPSSPTSSPLVVSPLKYAKDSTFQFSPRTNVLPSTPSKRLRVSGLNTMPLEANIYQTRSRTKKQQQQAVARQPSQVTEQIQRRRANTKAESPENQNICAQQSYYSGEVPSPFRISNGNMFATVV